MVEVFANKADSTLNGAITNASTALTIQTADVGKFPAAGNFRILVTDGINYELMLVTGGQGTATWTVTRAVEYYAGTQLAAGFADASNVYHVITQGALQAAFPVKYTEVVLSGTATTVILPASGTIPQTYRNIRITGQARSNIAATVVDMYIYFNGDTAANYNQSWVYSSSAAGGGNSIATNIPQIGQAAGSTSPAGSAAHFIINIPNYTGTTFRKVANGQCTGERADSAGNLYNFQSSVVWKSTAAITSVTFALGSSNTFVAGSTFSLYLEP